MVKNITDPRYPKTSSLFCNTSELSQDPKAWFPYERNDRSRNDPRCDHMEITLAIVAIIRKPLLRSFSAIVATAILIWKPGLETFLFHIKYLNIFFTNICTVLLPLRTIYYCIKNRVHFICHRPQISYRSVVEQLSLLDKLRTSYFQFKGITVRQRL